MSKELTGMGNQFCMRNAASASDDHATTSVMSLSEILNRKSPKKTNETKQ
jgi:hypothetical protein